MKIIALKINDRIKEAGQTQKVLTKFSSSITARLGFHEVNDMVCSREACMVLQVKDNAKEIIDELAKIQGVDIRDVCFCDDCKDDNAGAADILVILAKKDSKNVAAMQDVLTAYGCNIRTRLGLSSEENGEASGLIILQLTGDDDQRVALAKDLSALDAKVRRVIF